MRGEQPSVLVVDDEPGMVELFSAYLANEYDVLTASNGREAMETLDESIDVVTLDRRMPGMTGDDVAKRLNEAQYDCKVVMLSAVLAAEGDIPPCDEYLEKPVRKDELLSSISGVLQC